MVELEERPSPRDQPGKVRPLYSLTRGNLGSYLYAISLGEATVFDFVQFRFRYQFINNLAYT